MLHKIDAPFFYRFEFQNSFPGIGFGFHPVIHFFCFAYCRKIEFNVIVTKIQGGFLNELSIHKETGRASFTQMQYHCHAQLILFPILFFQCRKSFQQYSIFDLKPESHQPGGFV